MFCSNCGNKLTDDNIKFCPQCGVQITHTIVKQKEGVDHQSSKKKYGGFHMFKISQDELNWQLLNYDTLSITQSVRGIAALTIAGLLAFGIIIVVILNFTGNNQVSYIDILFSVVMYAPFIYFTYRGHRWAMILLGALYTVDKFYTSYVYSPDSFNVSTIIFWLLGIGPLWVAFTVEQARRRAKNTQ